MKLKDDSGRILDPFVSNESSTEKSFDLSLGYYKGQTSNANDMKFFIAAFERSAKIRKITVYRFLP